MDWTTLLNPKRPRPTTLTGDHRVEFERDYDRAIFSTPVKRLQDKAQVFPLEPHDAVRTRLTHSLEVAAVARGLAISTSKWLVDQKEIQPGVERQIEAIAAVCGLIHDLGNPPFGHAGEDAIREWFKRDITRKTLEIDLKGDPQRIEDLLNFEGNAQTLRLVAKLQILADFNGLNLTFGTLSAARKYIARSDEAKKDHENHAKAKPGFFASENSLIQQIEEATGTNGARNPIAYLVEAADDIVYLVADIEDGIKKGIISWAEVESELRGKRVDSGSADAVFSIKTRILSAGATGEAPNLPDDVHGSAFRTAAIAVLVPDAVSAFKAHYSAIMNGSYNGELVKDGAHVTLVKLFKTIGQTRIYNTHSTLKLEMMGRHIIRHLMSLFWEGAIEMPAEGNSKTNTFPGRLAALLSRNYRDVFQQALRTEPGVPPHYYRYQLVTDYVCGMTDTFARRLHRELTNG